jgi:glycerate dehydrogenase
MKIVVLDGHTLNPGDLSWAGFETLGEVTVHANSAPDEVAGRIGDADVVITNKAPITGRDIEACASVRYIGVTATGYNVVDVAAAKERGIPVCNVPTYGTMAVAQSATALMLELCNQVGRHSADVHAGGWSLASDWCYWLTPLVELDGKTLGIIGYGRIGQAFGRIGQALGMNVLAVDEHPDKRLESATMRYVSLDELYAQADVISLHCPLLANNKGMIDRQAIARMKPGAFLINASRGPLIVEQDLADALNAGRLGGAGLDVLSSEPPAADNPLLSAKNCIVTPHIAWAAKEARARLIAISRENLAAFLAGTPQNVVNG